MGVLVCRAWQGGRMAESEAEREESMSIREWCSRDDSKDASTLTTISGWKAQPEPEPELREVVSWSPVSMPTSESWDGTSKVSKLLLTSYSAESQREQNARAAQGMVAQVMELSSEKLGKRNGALTSPSMGTRRENFAQMLRMFMGLFNQSRKWKYAELWAPTAGSTRDRSAVLKMAYGVVSTDDEKVHKFHRYSEQLFIIGKECLPGRVWRTCKPEWLRCATDCRTSCRADMAFRCGIVVGFAVPVFAEDTLFGVLCFYDNSPHPFDAKSIYFASNCSHTLVSARKLPITEIYQAQATQA